MIKQLFVLVLLCCIGPVCSGQYNSYEKKAYINKGDTLRYRVMSPLATETTARKKFPLLIFLHGSGECGTDNEKQLIHGGAFFADSLNRLRFPAYVIFPQCPATDSWVRIKDLPNDAFELTDLPQPTTALKLVVALIREYSERADVDPKRIYICGISLGGMGTFDLICRYPQLFAAAVPICGAVNTDRLHKAVKIPVRMYHGDQDKIVATYYSRQASDKLKALGAKNASLIEIKGAGHVCWYKAFEQPDFLSWIFSQTR